MAWTTITRPRYQHDGLRCGSDTTDPEWAIIEPLMPPPCERGRTRTTRLRDVVDAIFYISQSGCQWRLLPKDFPPFTTVQHYFYRWRDDGTWQAINHVLLMAVREPLAGRQVRAPACSIASRSRPRKPAGDAAMRPKK
jgi:transposase